MGQMKEFYIYRTLGSDEGNLTEEELLEKHNIIIVLAEPGAGKTELLKSLANQLGIIPRKAKEFKYLSNTIQVDALVLDAFDEIAKLDQSAVDDILFRARETKAKQVILASRSSEWEEARSKVVERCFGSKPAIVRILPLNVEQQKAIFENCVPSEDFQLFKNEVEKFDLLPLLGNPQFLKLFADAFVQSGRRFTTKHGIFKDAVDRLAQEANDYVVQKNRPPIGKIVSFAEEIFAKLLLSGADGIGVSEIPGERLYPKITSLCGDTGTLVSSLIDSRLFKPALSEDKHEPVHRMIAEYCAANYLAKRLDSPADLLSLRRCLSIIAPNDVVRDELRGLVGWLAAFGSKEIQETIIDIDSYAVLANGDPSLLVDSSKRRLMHQLRKVADSDPHFRREDRWRTFSVAGFFSDALLDEFRQEIIDVHDSEYRDLLLELLESSGQAKLLSKELSRLMLNSEASFQAKFLAHRNLLTIDNYDFRADCLKLIEEGNLKSLKIAAKFLIAKETYFADRELLLLFLKGCLGLYSPPKAEGRRRVIGERYFIHKLVQTISLEDVVWLLNELVPEVVCKCSANAAYVCECRNGISKIVGRLLDRYFELRDDADDSAILWKWMKNLNFHKSTFPGASKSVEELKKNTSLRQGIHRHAFEGVSSSDEAWKIKHENLSYFSCCHDGLHFTTNDCLAIVDHAYEKGNVGLWISFFPSHNIYSKEHKRNDLRFHMRKQATEKPDFMKAWMVKVRSDRQSNKKYRKENYLNSYRHRKHRRERNEIEASNRQHLQENQDLIERGEHYGWLEYFAPYYLQKSESLEEIVDDATLPERALANGLPFIEKNLPSLSELVNLRRSSKLHCIEEILYASCLAIYKQEGSLERISKNTLTILKAISHSYRDYNNEDEEDCFDKELNRRLFQDISDIETFVQNYLEPLLTGCGEDSYEVGYFVDDPVFAPLFPSLALKWLESYPMMPKPVLKRLFKLCALQADRVDLVALIKHRCEEFKDSEWDESDDRLKHRQAFWYLRYFFFINEDLDFVSNWFKSDPNLIFSINGFTDPVFKDECSCAPPLTASKVFMILDCFVEKWPKVHLPDSWGTDSPNKERAYRALKNIFWYIKQDEPDQAIYVLNRIIEDQRFEDFRNDALSIRASAIRKIALREFQPPTPEEIVAFLDDYQLTTVEDLRVFLLEKLEEYQKRIDGGEFDSVDVFYENGNHVDEPTACKRVADHLSPHLKALDMLTVKEHQLKNSKRCDITATKTLDGKSRLLVIEAKGQWHEDLFSAAKTQLHERYSNHQDAENQGIYLVFWFGDNEKIEGRKNKSIKSATDLKDRIIKEMPEDIVNCIDVFVLDLSRK